MEPSPPLAEHFTSPGCFLCTHDSSPPSLSLSALVYPIFPMISATHADRPLYSVSRACKSAALSVPGLGRLCRETSPMLPKASAPAGVHKAGSPGGLNRVSARES